MAEVMGLLRYELKKTLSSYILTGLCLFLLIISVLSPNQTIPPICVFLLTTSLYFTDNANGYLELITSMPVKKSSVVIARYLHSFIITVVISVLPLIGGNKEYKEMFPFILLILSFYVACNLPFVMISYKYSSIFCIIGYLIMLGFTGTFAGLADLMDIKTTLFDFNISLFSSIKIVIIIWIVSLIVSIASFNRCYAKREGR